ncbi:M1 family metallopeptidase [Ferruginibacter profundus]
MQYKPSLRIVFLLFFSIHLQAQKMDISYMSSGGKLNPLQAIMDIRHYTLALDVNIDQQSIDGYTEIDLLLSRKTDTLLFDLVHFLKVKKITVNNSNTGFFQQGDYIFITNNNGFNAGKQKIKIEYGGKPPIAVRPPWKGGFTFTKDTNGNPWVAINCQLEGGKVYYPCKDHPSDEPDEGADLIITVPAGLTVAGPGLLQSVSKPKNNKQTFHWKTNYTISNYCILFNIAKYKIYNSTYTTVNGNKVPIQFYVLEADTAKAAHVLEIRARDCHILEKYFGEYPWIKEKMGIVYVPNPGMEHQTMISYGDRFTYKNVNGQDYSDNLYHEFGHEWWANKVTNKDWAHMWIQEGINTYAEALFFREVAGERAYDSVINRFKLSIANKKPIVQGDAVNTADTYTGDIYTKGAFFMHTLRHVIGDEIFFPTLKKLATDTNYTYHHFVTTDDVEQLFSKESKKELKPLFDFYLRTTEKLDIAISSTGYNEYMVQFKNLPMELPIDILTDAGAQHMLVKEKKIKIKSTFPPVIDAAGFYLKRIVTE